MAPDVSAPRCMREQVLDSLHAVSAAEWNRLRGAEHPLLRHEFLLAMETSGCVNRTTGWGPSHIVLRDDAGRLTGAMPLYHKSNSWGEFVFDWAWADAYRRAGLHYYPKLVAAVPFTPATSPRLLTDPNGDADAIGQRLLAAALSTAKELDASSLHVLFPATPEHAALHRAELLMRKDCQFHWHNQGYGDFDDFLGTFTAEKRKKTRRERRRVAEAGIRFRRLTGTEMTPQLWAEVMPLYASSFWRRGREPYLNQAFFEAVAKRLPDNLLLVLAELNGEPVAVAIFFRSHDVLYGRYWGSAAHFHSLHFETCYYQGIDYCIEHGLQRFEPGTQGEHKLARGFVPAETWSAHWLAHPRFAAAVDDYLAQERGYIDRYIDVAAEHVPYRRGATGT